MILLNVWEGVDPYTEAAHFAELWGVDGPVLVDEGEKLIGRLGIRGVPTNIFVDADGTVREVGAVTPEDLEAATRRLLGPGADVEPPAGAWRWYSEAG